MQTAIARSIGFVEFAEGQRKTLEIDRDGVLSQLNIRLKYTITNGVSAAVGPLFNTLARYMRRIEVIVAGRDTVVNISGEALAARARFEFGNVPFGMGDTVVLTGSAATTYEIVLPIAFWLPRGRRPDDASLDLRDNRIHQVIMAITWGTIDDFYTTPNSAAISSVTCEVEGEYMLDVDPGKRFLARVLDQQERELTGTSNNFDFILDKGSQLFYRSFLITALAGQVADNAILDTGAQKLQAGSFVWQNRKGLAIRAENKRDFNQETAVDGVYYLRAAKYGELVDYINSGVLTSDLKLTLDATKQSGTNLITVFREAVRPLDIG